MILLRTCESCGTLVENVCSISSRLVVQLRSSSGVRMPAFTVAYTPRAPCPFQVVGPDGTLTVEINDYLVYLVACGRSAYTQRSYAAGLAHFCSWLYDAGTPLDAVTRQIVGRYITAFSRGAKTGACPPDPQRAGQVNLLTRKSYPSAQRQPRTINHRLSVLAAFYAFRIQQDDERGAGPWLRRANPVASSSVADAARHGMAGRDAPPRGRSGEFRRRVPRHIPKQLDPTLVARLIDTAVSWRDKAILTLLHRTGQRIGDWSDVAGRHGVLGMTLADVDEQRKTITVRLKGARDEHRVPVTADFWPFYHHYLRHERPADGTTSAVWLGFRKGRGEPLSYAAFESALRYVGRKLGANINAHLFRHTLAQGVLDTTGNLKVAQELLGHAHISTTADLYTQIDQHTLVAAVGAVKSAFDAVRAGAGSPATPPGPGAASPATPEGAQGGQRYAFAYERHTIAELDQAATQEGPPGQEGRSRW